MPNVSSFGAQTDNSVVQGTVTDRAMVIPDIPPQGLMSVGPRMTPHFVKPSLWSALTTYHFFDAVHDAAGASYVAIKPEVPAGTELTDEGYWFLWADPNSQFADLSELVKTYNGRITQNTNDIDALKTSTETRFTALDKKIDDNVSELDGKIQLNTASIDKLKTHKILVMGDSWVDPIKGYGNVLAKELQKTTRAEVVCKGYSGAGWNKPGEVGKTFEDLINEVIALPDRDTYDCVIFIGGINNGNEPESSLSRNIEQGLSKLQNAFNKVRYVVNSNGHDVNTYFSSWNKLMLNASSNNHVPYSFVNDYVSNVYYRDLSHLSNVGYAYLARYLTALAYNGTVTPTASSVFNINGSKNNAPGTTVNLRLISSTSFSTTGLGLIEVNLTAQEIAKSESWNFNVENVDLPNSLPKSFNYPIYDNYGNMYSMRKDTNTIIIQPTYMTEGSGRTVNINSFVYNRLGLFFG